MSTRMVEPGIESPEWTYHWGVNDLFDVQVPIEHDDIGELLAAVTTCDYVDVVPTGMDIKTAAIPGVTGPETFQGTDPPRVVVRRGHERREFRGRKIPQQFMLAEVWPHLSRELRDRLTRAVEPYSSPR